MPATIRQRLRKGGLFIAVTGRIFGDRTQHPVGLRCRRSQPVFQCEIQRLFEVLTPRNRAAFHPQKQARVRKRFDVQGRIVASASKLHRRQRRFPCGRKLQSIRVSFRHRRELAGRPPFFTHRLQRRRR